MEGHVRSVVRYARVTGKATVVDACHGQGVIRVFVVVENIDRHRVSFVGRCFVRGSYRRVVRSVDRHGRGCCIRSTVPVTDRVGERISRALRFVE